MSANHVDAWIASQTGRFTAWLASVQPRSRAVGWVVVITGLGVLLLAAWLFGWSSWRALKNSPGHQGIVETYLWMGSFMLPTAVAILAGGAGFRLVQLGRRRMAKAESLAIDDGQPFVLYLRSFVDDVTTARVVPRFGMLNEEEHLAQTLGSMGPLLSIGMPGEQLPQLGANRVLVDDALWRAAVQRWIGQAQLIVLRIGETAGFWWEVDQVLHLAPPSKVLFVVPHGQLHYQEFVRRLREKRPTLRLPPYCPRATEAGVSIAAVLAFADENHLEWHACGLPRSSLAQLVEPLAMPLARMLGAALGRDLKPRLPWLTHIVTIGVALLKAGYWLLLLSFPLAIAGIFTMVWWLGTSSPEDETLINLLYVFSLVLVGGFCIGLAWWMRSVFAAGPVWPGRRRPDEPWHAHFARLWRMQRMRRPRRVEREKLVREALGEPVADGDAAISLEALERAFHAASGLIGSDHPDLVPILMRLSVAYEAGGRSYDAVMSQAAAAHLGRRFFGPGHPKHLANCRRLDELLQENSTLRSAELSYILSGKA